MLSSESYKLLVKFSRRAPSDALQNAKQECLDQLASAGLIESHIIDYVDDPVMIARPVYSEYRITEDGKGYIRDHRVKLLIGGGMISVVIPLVVQIILWIIEKSNLLP